MAHKVPLLTQSSDLTLPARFPSSSTGLLPCSHVLDLLQMSHLLRKLSSRSFPILFHSNFVQNAVYSATPSMVPLSPYLLCLHATIGS